MARAKALGQEHAWCESRDTAPGAGAKGVGWACGGPAALGCGGVWDGSQARASCVMGAERAGTAVAGCGRTHALTPVGRRSSSRVRSGLDVSVPRLFWLQRLLGAP